MFTATSAKGMFKIYARTLSYDKKFDLQYEYYSETILTNRLSI